MLSVLAIIIALGVFFIAGGTDFWSRTRSPPKAALGGSTELRTSRAASGESQSRVIPQGREARTSIDIAFIAVGLIEKRLLDRDPGTAGTYETLGIPRAVAVAPARTEAGFRPHWSLVRIRFTGLRFPEAGAFLPRSACGAWRA